MLETSARLLRLLSLLQLPRDWTGPQLAERLEVTGRTIRNDVERLRTLGYPVHATPGVHGGYRLGAGASLPPLLLDDDEAVAVAVGLRTAAGGSVQGIEESSLRALTKLEQVLPSRLRQRVSALHGATIAIPIGGPTVTVEVLSTLAGAIRGRECLRFDYESFEGTTTLRTAEPHHVVHTRGRWYLLAWDRTREDWRTFRADRIRPRMPTGPRFVPREVPGGDVVAHIEEGLGTATWRFRATVRVHAPADAVIARLPPAVVVEALDEHTCIAHVGSDSPHTLALWLGMIDEDFEVHDCPELIQHLRTLSARYGRAADQVTTTPAPRDPQPVTGRP